MQAEEQTENLNALQRLLQLEPHPTVETLRKPDTLHTAKHLSAWFDQWLQVYELLPHMIHPKSVEDAKLAAEAAADGDKDAEGEDDNEGEEKAEEDEEKAEEEEPEIDPNDRRVLLKPEQVKEVCVAAKGSSCHGLRWCVLCPPRSSLDERAMFMERSRRPHCMLAHSRARRTGSHKIVAVEL